MTMQEMLVGLWNSMESDGLQDSRVLSVEKMATGFKVVVESKPTTLYTDLACEVSEEHPNTPISPISPI